jgi:formylglycine-generating enzyme required for sulfatase activity
VGYNYPVTHVDWYDVVKWCNARSEKEGKTPVYKNGTAVYRTGNVSEPALVASATGYRLPSEKEWEFAARGGTQTKGYTYSGSNDLSLVGWYDGNSGAVKEVGKKQANELGIYDMSGNLLEWSGSWYPSYEGLWRVIRGGCWFLNAGYCTVTSRDLNFPEYRGILLGRDLLYGFRVALSSVP